MSWVFSASELRISVLVGAFLEASGVMIRPVLIRSVVWGATMLAEQHVRRSRRLTVAGDFCWHRRSRALVNSTIGAIQPLAAGLNIRTLKTTRHMLATANRRVPLDAGCPTGVRLPPGFHRPRQGRVARRPRDEPDFGTVVTAHRDWSIFFLHRVYLHNSGQAIEHHRKALSMRRSTSRKLYAVGRGGLADNGRLLDRHATCASRRFGPS